MSGLFGRSKPLRQKPEAGWQSSTFTESLILLHRTALYPPLIRSPSCITPGSYAWWVSIHFVKSSFLASKCRNPQAHMPLDMTLSSRAMNGEIGLAVNPRGWFLDARFTFTLTLNRHPCSRPWIA